MRSAIISLFFLLLLFPAQSFGKCSGNFLDIINDVEWTGVYPIRMGGMTISPSFPEKESLIEQPICKCKDGALERIGVTVGFREPARLIDVVKDPYCLNAIGVELDDSDIWGGGGYTRQSNGEQQNYFAQAHLYIFPVWSILEILADFTCQEVAGFDLAYMTEFDPLWNDDMMANILSPESLLFASPPAQMACAADSVASTAGYPLTPLFWCNGSWGGIYPIGGTSGASGIVKAAAGVSTKLIYKLHRELLMFGTKGEMALCGKFPLPVWRKDQYRLQILKPQAGEMLFPIGRTSLLWGELKNSLNPEEADNFSYVLWRYRDCCSF